NVWASWCFACRIEHEVITDLATSGPVPVYGLNWKDQRPDALRWLQQFGDPYRASAYDESGRVGIDFGVYGAPETFLIDASGQVRYKHIGPLTPEIVQNELLPAIAEVSGG
ncbi:MAG: DsbE family thiol:disulfide interchange protein, partial [Pseudomonadota bacterium]